MGALKISDQKVFDSLTDKQKIFCNEYVIDLNAGRAAKEAGYKLPSIMGRKLLKKKPIQKAIAALMEPALKGANLDRENVLHQLQRFVFCNIIPYLDADGHLKCKPEELPEDIQQCIVGFETTNRYSAEGDLLETRYKIKLVDKLASVFKAMDYLKMIGPQEHHHTFDWAAFYDAGKGDNPDVVEGMLAKLEQQAEES